MTSIGNVHEPYRIPALSKHREFHGNIRMKRNCSVPSPCRNQCWFIVDYAHRNKLHWNWTFFKPSYRADKPHFIEFCIKMAKMTLKVSVNDPHFQYQPSVYQDACLVKKLTSLAQVCDELLRGRGKVYGQTDGRTDTGNDNTPPAWKAKELILFERRKENTFD